ncbi:MAG: hypothetical protein KC492_35640, partial [Myxococcales bacterium]|nr:hypothetical protein [Myxococcales bacterium]
MLFKSGTIVFLGGLVGYLAFLGACSDTKSSGNSLSGRDGFCQSWANAACNDAVVKACSGDGADPADCQATQSAACLSAVGDSYDSTNAKSCIDAVKKAYQDAKLSRADVDVLELKSGACAELFKGTKEEGDSCSNDAECDTISGYRCIGESPTCQIPAEVGGGGKCSDPAAVCASGFYCDGTNCLQAVGVGQSCVDEPCTEDLLCLAGTCTAKTADVQDCSKNDDCQSGLCDVPRGASTGLCVTSFDLAVTSS